MIAYLTKRLAMVFFVFLSTTFLTFLMLELTPGDTAEIIIKKVFVGTLEYVPSIEEKEYVKDVFELRDPAYIAYVKWLLRAIRGDLGTSYVTGRSVLYEISIRLPYTTLLAVLSISIAFVISLLLGMLSAQRRGWVDRMTSLYSSLFIAMPSFCLALVLIILFSVNLRILPIIGFVGIESLLMPTIALSLPISAVLTQVVRASFVEEMEKEYVRTAISKGLKENEIFRKHILKNSMIPVVTLTGLQFANLMGGVVIVETIFSWPGIGKLLVDSVDYRDIPVIQGCVTFITLIFAITNLLVDLSYKILDPRVKM